MGSAAMPDHLKALIVVIGIAFPVFMLLRSTLLFYAYDASTFRRHTYAWSLVTFIAFLSHNFWVFSFLVALSMYSFAKRDGNPMALYFATLFAAPHFVLTLPGFGPIDNFFDVNYIRVLNLAVLLPIALKLCQRNYDRQSRVPLLLDIPLILFLILCAAKYSAIGSVTMTLRSFFDLFVDIWLPYYVASRGLRTLSEFKVLAGAATLGITIIAAVAIFESGRHWLLYESLRVPLGVPDGGQVYIPRVEGGPLRAITVTTFPIVLGYVIMFGLGFFAYIAPRLRPFWRTSSIWLLLVGGLLASLSRGPWVGAVAVALVMIAIGPNATKRIVWSVVIAGVSVLIMSTTTRGRLILELLPFIGSAETENVEYRQRLWDVSMAVFWQNPLLGDLRYIENPMMEQMRQGQGLIDIVNSFLQVALPYGFVGVTLFCCALLFPTVATWRVRAKLSRSSVEAERLGRSLLALMAGVLVTISTASGIGAISTLYWILAGLLVSYSRLRLDDGPSKMQEGLPEQS